MINYDKEKVVDIKVSKDEYEKALSAIVIRICCDDKKYKNCCITTYVEDEIVD